MATLADIVTKDSTNRSVTLRIIDATDGTPETGVVFDTAGIDMWYRREGAAVVSVTEVTLALLTTAHADGGFLHISDGEYRFDLPDAAFATGVEHVDFGGTVTGMVVIGGRVRLSDLDMETVMRGTDSAATAATIGTPIDADIATDINNVKSVVDNLGASSGGAIKIAATEDNTSAAIIDGVTKVWATVSGTFANVEFDDGTSHDFTDTTDVIDHVYGFSVGGSRQGVAVGFIADVAGNNDEMVLQVFDHVGSGWDTIKLVSGAGGTSVVSGEPGISSKHTGTGSELGKVYVRFATATTTPSDLSVTLLEVLAVNIGQSVGYSLGRVYGDTNSGTAGTESFVNGVADNDALLFSDMQTILTAVGLKDFHLRNGSSIVLDNTMDNRSFFGDNWTLGLGTQSCAGIHVTGAQVSGVGTAASGEMHFEGCDFGTASVQRGHFDFCGFGDTITHTLASDYNYHDCYSKVAGAGAPVFAKTAGQAVTVEFRRWSGSVTFSGLEVGDTITVSGELGTVDLGSPAGAVAVEIRGTYKAIANVGSASVNTDGAIKGVDVASTLADTNELQTDWTDGGRLDLILDIIAVDTTTDIPALIATAQADLDIITGATGVNLLTATQASIDAIEVDTGTTIPALIATAQADLDIITGATGVNLLTATQASIDAIEVDTGTTIPALIATAQADLDIITGATGVNLLTATQASIDAIEVDTGTTIPAQITGLNDIAASDILTTALTESYAADGATFTLAQALYMLHSSISEFAIAGTVLTAKKLDGSTTAMTFTLDDASDPTSRTRAT